MEIENLHDVYLALGTNLGNKEENIFQALKLINERVGMVIIHSALYRTASVGFDSENEFINAACLVMTSMEPLELLKATQQIELELGRDSKSVDKQYADRIIDIDILLYDRLVSDDAQLQLPHPHMHERAFVLTPLAEIAAQYIHPTLHQSIGELEHLLQD